MAYSLLDAARMGDELDQAKRLADRQPYCLYKGSAEEKLGHVAPHLFTTEQLPFVDWLFDTGWGQSWGILLISETTPELLHRHLRRFLRIKTEDNRQLYFRFYDPRVLRLFLPICDQQQLLDFFGPVRYFLMEDRDPNFGLNFWLEQGQLKQSRVEKAAMKAAFINHLQNQRG